jgi:hypothetical protein
LVWGGRQESRACVCKQYHQEGSVLAANDFILCHSTYFPVLLPVWTPSLAPSPQEQAAASLGKTVKAHKPYWAAMARLDVARTFKLSSRLIVQGPAWAHCDGRHELVMNRDDGCTSSSLCAGIPVVPPTPLDPPTPSPLVPPTPTVPEPEPSSDGFSALFADIASPGGSMVMSPAMTTVKGCPHVHSVATLAQASPSP